MRVYKWIAGIAAITCLATSAYAAKAPNIVLIYIDDMGFADLGANGSDVFTHTPNMDALAASGIRFSKGYVSAPMCGPSRAALVTGRYHTRFGYEQHKGARRQDENTLNGLPLSERTIADYLKDAGYRTFAFGKWHLGSDLSQLPHRRGFDEYYGIVEPGNQNFLMQNHHERGIVFWEEPIDYPKGTVHLSEAYTRQAIDFVTRQAQKKNPFFMYMAYTAIHAPNESTGEYIKRVEAHFEEKGYNLPEMPKGHSPYETPLRKRIKGLAQLWQLDDEIGRFIQHLETTGLRDNTLVFLISDNGGRPDDNGSWNVPYGGVKGQLHEGGIHVPFIVSWPARFPAGKVYDKPVMQIDVLPTALAVAGQSLPQKIDGVNLLPFLCGNKAGEPHEALYWRVGDNWAIIKEGWKLVHANKTFHDFSKDPPRLFNLNDDPYETEDLSAQQPERVKQLRAAYDKWNRDNVHMLFGSARHMPNGIPWPEEMNASPGRYNPLTGERYE